MVKQELRIVHRTTGEVVEKVDVTGMPTRMIERMERGMEINLNHKEFRVHLHMGEEHEASNHN